MATLTVFLSADHPFEDVQDTGVPGNWPKAKVRDEAEPKTYKYSITATFDDAGPKSITEDPWYMVDDDDE